MLEGSFFSQCCSDFYSLDGASVSETPELNLALHETYGLSLEWVFLNIVKFYYSLEKIEFPYMILVQHLNQLGILLNYNRPNSLISHFINV